MLRVPDMQKTASVIPAAHKNTSWTLVVHYTALQLDSVKRKTYVQCISRSSISRKSTTSYILTVT